MVIQDPVILNKIGFGFIQSGQYNMAIDFLSKSNAMLPNNSETLGYRGAAYYRILDINKSIIDLEKAIQIDSNNHYAHGQLGAIATERQDFIAAEYHYQNALNTSKDNLDYLPHLAFAKGSLKKIDKAIELCDEILKIEHNRNVWAIQYRADLFIEKKMYLEALNDFVYLLNNNLDNSELYNYVGYIYSKINIYDLAKENLNNAIKYDPDNFYAYSNLGYVYAQEGNLKEALRLINISINLNVANSYAYKNRAIVWLKYGYNEKAIQDLNMAKYLGYNSIYDSEVDDLLTTLL